MEDTNAILEGIREELEDIWNALYVRNVLLLAQLKIASGLEMNELYAILDEIGDAALSREPARRLSGRTSFTKRAHRSGGEAMVREAIKTLEGALETLMETGALLEGHFQLDSGLHSPFYLEVARLLEWPQQLERLCRHIADRFRGEKVQVVVRPATGGIISYGVARQLGTRAIWAERVEGDYIFPRGFSIAPGERVLIVDDVLTTGDSVTAVLEAVRSAGGTPIGVGILADCTGGRLEFDVPLYVSLPLELAAYERQVCPLCRWGIKLSRRDKHAAEHPD